jgi:hypothetical protein
MDNEVNPKVLEVINEKRLSGPRLNPVEIVAKMGVLDARDKAFEYAWLASGDSVIASIWAEFVRVGDNGRWFYVESLNTEFKAGGGARSANQAQRAKDRLALLKRTFDNEEGFRAVLQTNRIPILEVESSRSAKVSSRVRDDQEWHVATWSSQEQIAILVRGERGWSPSESEVEAAIAAAHLSVPKVSGSSSEDGEPGEPLSADDLNAAAMAYVLKHFSSYGYKAEDVSGQGLGYAIEVTDKKGATLLKVAVRGVSTPSPGIELSDGERRCSELDKLWRLLVVTDPLSGTALHKIYKPSEIPQGQE